MDFISYKLHNSFDRFAFELIKPFIDFTFHEICGFNILFIDAALLKPFDCYQTLSTFCFDLIQQYSIRFLRALQLLNLIFLSYQYLYIVGIFSSKLPYLSFSFSTLNICPIFFRLHSAISIFLGFLLQIKLLISSTLFDIFFHFLNQSIFLILLLN